MSKLINLECPRCGKTQEEAWHNRKVCAPCRAEEERLGVQGPKGKAWAAVNRALRSGALARKPCEVCSHITSQAHHDDYARPLDIRWLCRSHHRQHHNKFGPGKNAYATQGETA
jgi:hypothetical protein